MKSSGLSSSTASTCIWVRSANEWRNGNHVTLAASAEALCSCPSKLARLHQTHCPRIVRREFGAVESTHIQHVLESRSSVEAVAFEDQDEGRSRIVYSAMFVLET